MVRRLGLPPSISACLFDMDGVLTRTAKLHAAAWKRMFDNYLAARAGTDQPFVPFDIDKDYAPYVDGKVRSDGVRSFLASRGIVLPDGDMNDLPGSETVAGLGNLKNEMILQLMAEGGVEAFEGSRRYVELAQQCGLPVGVVSASANTVDVLRASGLEGMFDVVVDGNVAISQGLKGKPAPDSFLFAAASLHVTPAATAVFEDAIAGVAAGRAGKFAYVVGVNRLNQAAALKEAGADIVVEDLADLLDANEE